MFKSGYITVIGRSNVGKSTLLNRIIGENLSIISSKPQTTRNKMLIIRTTEDSQMIFVDTPGIQKPRTKLGEFMLKTSVDTLKDADIVTYIVDHSDFIGELEQYIINELKQVKKPLILLINKVDLISNDRLQKIKSMYRELNLFHEIIGISASNNINIDKYIDIVKKYLPNGPMYYEKDQLTDKPIRFVLSEIIREKTLIYLREEIPHGIHVEIESMKQRENKDIMDIQATISVEKKSHKGMVIGKNGNMLKKIGTASRLAIENFLQQHIHLQLWVKIDTDWRNNSNKIKSFGFNK